MRTQSLESVVQTDNVESNIEEVDVDVSIVSYAPRVFKFIRAIDNIDELDIMMSVKPSMNEMQIFKTNEHQSHSEGGKSGSMFFFTQDKNFIIK